MRPAFQARERSQALIAFLRAEATLSPRRALLVAATAGLSNAMILAIINSAAQHAAQSHARPLFAVFFAAAMFIYLIAQRWILVQAADQVEAIIHRVRMRIVRRLRTCELLDVEHLGRAVVYSALTRHTQTLSQSASTITIAVQMLILVCFTSLYIAWISLTAFATLVVFMAIALSIYFRRSFSVRNNLQATLEMDNDVYTAIDDYLDGFKEMKLSRAKAWAVQGRIDAISEHASQVRGQTQVLLAKNFVFSQAAFYLLLGTMVFVVPTLTHGFSDVVQKTTTAVLFIIGPLSGVIGSIPIFENASAAARAIMEMEQRVADLSRSADGEEPHAPSATPVPFKSLELRGVVFRYGAPGDEHRFQLGPIDLRLDEGKVLFITGGNGSGKSTLLRVLTGLYPVESGEIMLDGERVGADRLQDFRERFAAVFGDFHLSRHLDGVADEALVDAPHWLARFELDRKVELHDRMFSTVDLSTGQRKRLALVAALLERRPVLLLDEWAADQDPNFRRVFYRDILPEIRARGHTVIAVTHDNRYFSIADGHMHMEDGTMAEFNPETFHD